MKLIIKVLIEKDSSASCKAFICLVLTVLSACASIPEPARELMPSPGNQNTTEQDIQVHSDELEQMAGEATLTFTRSDIVESPEKYIDVELYRDDFGHIFASFRNNSNIPLSNVQVQFLTSMGGLNNPSNSAKASVIGDIGDLGTNNIVDINVSYLDFPLPMGVGVRIDQVEIRLLSVELE